MKNKTNVSLSLRKLLLSALVAAPLATLPSPLWALPTSQTNLDSLVTLGSGVTATYVNNNRVNVSATNTNSIIRWSDFGGGTNTIGASDLIAYTLPSNSASILNVVTGANPTTVNGTLTANGNLYILNPNGITIGATGVITANGIGLSTVPETEFYFNSTGTLELVENQNIATTTAVTVSPGAMLTAASGTGNVWVAGLGANVAGTIDAGSVTAKSLGNGVVTLGAGGDLTVGNVAVRTSTVTATTQNGAVNVNNNVTVWGPSVSLTAGGNSTITQTGTLQIGAGAGQNATLTTSSGTGTQSIANAIINGTGTLTVNATGGTVGIASAAGKLAVAGTTGALTVTSAGDLTFNAPKVTTLTATSGSGNITTTGAVDASGAIALTVAANRDVSFTAKNTLAPTITGAGTGNVSLTSTTGDVTVPTLTVAGLTVNSSAGAITLGGAQTITNAASLTANKSVTLGQTVSAGSLTVSAGTDLSQTAAVDSAGAVSYTATSGNVSIASTVGATTAPSSLTISAGKKVDITGAVIAKAITATANTDLTVGATLNSTGSPGSFSLTATTGNVTTTGVIGGTAAPVNVTINAGKLVDIGAAITATGNISATAATNLTNSAAIASGAGANKLTLTTTGGNITVGGTLGGGNITVGSAGLLTVNSNITGAVTTSLNATGNVSLTATVAGPTTNITGNAISESGAGLINATTATLTSSTAITAGGANTVGTLIVKSTPGTAAFTDADGLIIGNGTNVAGNLTITGGAGALVFGAAASDAITVSGNLSLTAGANQDITDATNNITVLGNTSLTTSGTGVVTINGNATIPTSAVGLNHQFGVVNITTANQNATIYEKTTLNLGDVSLGTADLTAYSSSSIINSGNLALNDILIGAGTATMPGSITLNSSVAAGENAITGTITLMTDLWLLGSATVGNYLASDLTVSNGVDNAALLAIGTNVYQTGSTAAIKLTAVGAGIDLGIGAVNTSGAVTLESGTGSITATGANLFNNVTVNSNGVVDVRAEGDLTVNGTFGGGASTVNLQAGTGADSVGTLTIGTIRSSNTGAITLAADSTKAVTDSVAGGAGIFGPVTMTGGSVNITNVGHSFGPVSITTASNGNATIVEAGTLNLATIALGTGRLTATSLSGSIIDSGAITATGLTASAASGAVTLDSATNAIAGAVSITAVNNSALVNTVNTQLGNTTVSNGTLTVDLSGTANRNITQAGNSTIYAYGNTVLSVAGTGAITLDNTGNRFGQIRITTAGGAATIREQTTVNLGATTTAGGALTVRSTGGGIIDSGAITATGTATLAAASDITLDNPTNSFGTVLITAGGNVLITDNTGDLNFNASTIGGTLTVNNNSGNLTQSAAAGQGLSVGGDTTFNMTLPASFIRLDNDQNQFGGLKFVVGSGTTTIVESTSMELRAGSIAYGQVTLNTGGDFTTSGTGASQFFYTAGTPSLRIIAIGSITPGAGSLDVYNGLRLETLGAINLGGLSLSGNLHDVAPTRLYTSGPYTAPQP